MNVDAEQTSDGVGNNFDGQVTSSQNFGSEEERQNFVVEFYLKYMKCFIVCKNSFEFTEGVLG
jgi:hypothetical protein